jgi:hypothetical protein
MTSIKELLRPGPDHAVEIREGGATFRPNGRSSASLAEFQRIVRLLDGINGDGFQIIIRHHRSTTGGNLVDLVKISLP